jgi:hypothetical protein
VDFDVLACGTSRMLTLTAKELLLNNLTKQWLSVMTCLHPRFLNCEWVLYVPLTALPVA